MKRRLVLGTLLGLGVAAMLPLRAGSSSVRPVAGPRVITMEARGMAFRVDGSDAANPVLRLRAGETVKVVLRNREPGMIHDFAVPSLKVAMGQLESHERGEVTFRAPASRGRHEYLCRPHAVMMKGTIEVE